MNFPFPKQALVFACIKYKFFENTVEQGEIACNEQFLHVPNCYLHVWRTFCHISSSLKFSAATFLSLIES